MLRKRSAYSRPLVDDRLMRRRQRIERLSPAAIIAHDNLGIS
jgi:hypothetical protein